MSKMSVLGLVSKLNKLNLIGYIMDLSAPKRSQMLGKHFHINFNGSLIVHSAHILE